MNNNFSTRVRSDLRNPLFRNAAWHLSYTGCYMQIKHLWESGIPVDILIPIFRSMSAGLNVQQKTRLRDALYSYKIRHWDVRKPNYMSQQHYLLLNREFLR